jgi:hypothetical protein
MRMRGLEDGGRKKKKKKKKSVGREGRETKND